MFRLYRRHRRRCEAPVDALSKCSCPLWLDLRAPGRPRDRRSLKTRSIEVARKRAARLELAATGEAPAPAPTLTAAARRYLDDCRARALAPATLRSYETLLDILIESFGVLPVDEVTTETLTNWRATRSTAASTAIKEISNLRAFFSWCVVIRATARQIPRARYGHRGPA
jgi:hypothetical protein